MLFVIKNRSTGEYYRDSKKGPDLRGVTDPNDADLFTAQFDFDGNGISQVRVTPELPFNEKWLSGTDPLCAVYEMVPVKIKPIQEL